MVDVVGAGVSIVGGCCGTNPDYIRALHDAVHTMMPGARDIHHGSFLWHADDAAGNLRRAGHRRAHQSDG